MLEGWVVMRRLRHRLLFLVAMMAKPGIGREGRPGC
jgi:hypothetical protein